MPKGVGVQVPSPAPHPNRRNESFIHKAARLPWQCKRRLGNDMQVTEIAANGLQREFKITIPASELDEKLNTRLESLKDRVNLKGFRPGKVPVEHLRKAYGQQVMGEIIEETVNESSQKALEERSLRAAVQPKIDIESDADDVTSGRSDLEFKVEVELMPDFDIIDLKTLKLERPVAEVGEAEIDEQIEAIAAQMREYEPRGEGEKAESGDQLQIDFDGSVDGKAFDGGRAEDMALVLGSGSFIPGFEDQLIGVNANAETTVKVTFPADYPVEDLAGKDASFAVKVRSISKPTDAAIDDAFAKKVGLEDLAALKDAVRGRIKSEYDQASRMQTKRALLDKLDEGHEFELPKGMVDAEFHAIWHQVLQDLEQRGKTIEDEAESEEAMRAEYRTIAERRVRLGLVLAEIGQKNNIDVTQDELSRALNQLSRQYPGQEKQVYEYYQQNMGAMAQLRAPIFEDKVVDFILELVEVTDKTVSKDDLLRDPDEE